MLFDSTNFDNEDDYDNADDFLHALDPRNNEADWVYKGSSTFKWIFRGQSDAADKLYLPRGVHKRIKPQDILNLKDMHTLLGQKTT